MSAPTPEAAPWPRWLVALASVPIVYHLGAVLLGAVVAPSGPWPTPEGPQAAVPPPAVAMLHESATRRYLQAAGLTHDYHFASNRVGGADAYLEIWLEDDAGKLLKTVRFPDPEASPFVRARQARLIRWLVEDQPVAPPGGERIFPPGTLPPRVPFWDMTEPRRLVLVELPEPEIPRGRVVFRPTPWSMVVIKAVARHACRVHGAAHARVVRHSKESLSPAGLLEPQTIPQEMEELVSDYGRVTR